MLFAQIDLSLVTVFSHLTCELYVPSLAYVPLYAAPAPVTQILVGGATVVVVVVVVVVGATVVVVVGATVVVVVGEIVVVVVGATVVVVEVERVEKLWGPLHVVQAEFTALKR